jgi:hypothetical protein
MRHVKRDPERHLTSKLFPNRPEVTEWLVDVTDVAAISSVYSEISDVDLQKFLDTFSLSAFDAFVRDPDDTLEPSKSNMTEAGASRFRWRWPANGRIVYWCVMTPKVDTSAWVRWPVNGRNVQVFTKKDDLIVEELRREREYMVDQIAKQMDWKWILRSLSPGIREGATSETSALEAYLRDYHYMLEKSGCTEIKAASDEIEYGYIWWDIVNARISRGINSPE